MSPVKVVIGCQRCQGTINEPQKVMHAVIEVDLCEIRSEAPHARISILLVVYPIENVTSRKPKHSPMNK